MTSAADAETPAAAEGLSPVAPETIVARLRSGRFPLNLETARLVRDRAAEYLNSQPERSRALATALLRAARRGGDALDAATRATVWRTHAEAHVFTGRLRVARRSYEAARREARGLAELEGQILVGMVHLLSLMGRSRDAGRYARRAQEILRSTGDLVYLGKLYMNRGNAFYQKDRYAEALEAYREAAEVFERAGVRDATWAGLLMNQAVACTNLVRIEEARKIFARTEDQCRRLGLEVLGARAQYNRAFLEALYGDYRLALRMLEEAGRVFERHGILEMKAAAQRERAEIYLELGMARESADLAHSAAEAFTTQKMALDATLARVLEARALARSDRPDAGLAILEAALRFYRRRRLRPRQAAVLLQQARIHLQCERAREALRVARGALRSFESLRAPHARSEARRAVSAALLARGAQQEAEATLAPALRSSRRLSHNEQLELWALAARIARARGDRCEAIRRLRCAVRHLERQRELIPGMELRARAFEDRVGVYHELVELLLEGRKPGFSSLFRLVEAARARGFRDRVSLADERIRSIVSDQRARLGSLARRLEELEFGRAGLPEPETINRIRGRMRTLEARIAFLIRRAEEARGESVVWRGTVDPDRIGASLYDDEALVEYFVAGDAIVALVLSRRSRALRVVSRRGSDVLRSIERVRLQIDAMTLSAQGPRGDPDFLRRAAEHALHALYTALLAPLEDLLPDGGRLTVVPHRYLHRVPFECLWDGKEYVDHRWIVARSPTADFLLRRAGTTPVADGKVLVCGSLRSGPSGVPAEMESVASFFPAERVSLLRDARGETILSSMSSARLVHITTHAIFREDNPLFSRLTTGNDPLFLADVIGKRLMADLVVLSACNTGRVFSGQGDDLSGVAHGFLEAGARRLVASLWRVHDRATQALMRSFYAHLTGGAQMDPALALSRAGREVRGEWPHPFYWGSFSVYGT